MSIMYLKCWLVLLVLAVDLRAEQCITPNDEKAMCISLYSCPVLLQALMTQNNATVEFVSRSNCGGTAVNPMVCCGSTSEFQGSQKHDLKLLEDVRKDQLLPDRNVCGYQHSDDYFRPSNAISITEFPWLARIMYKMDGEELPGFLCSGSLINKRYVLTSAYCLLLAYAIPVSVRLGEYHTKNDTDCVDEDPFVTECSEPVQDIAIEEVITHIFYHNRRLYRINDIGIIRLKEIVIYTDYVRPICLPLPGSKMVEVGDTLLLSGWGSMQDGDRFEVSIKKKIFATLVANDECTTLFQEHNYNFRATEAYICNLVFSNNTDFHCIGDYGGPVTFIDRYEWILVGIVSFNANLCSPKAMYPELNTNVAYHIDWILENIKP